MKKKKLPMTRSENMARIKGKNTKPEVYLREILWDKGIRYVKNCDTLPGKPDIYIVRYNTAIFVNGCFWHMHKGCKNSNIPHMNREFWIKKLKANVERDRRNYADLYEKKVKVIVVWECTIRAMWKDSSYAELILDKIIQAITANECDKIFFEF